LDTGAFIRGYYGKFFHKNTPLESLEIPADSDSLAKYVGLFYSSNIDYYSGRSTKNVEIRATEFNLQGLHELARLPAMPPSEGVVSSDERSSSIEIQFAAGIELRDNVLAIILPGVFLGEPEIKEYVSKVKPMHLETYDTMHGMGPQGVAAVVYDRLLTVYRREGLLP